MIPGTSVRVAAALTASDSLDDAQRVGVVVVRSEDHLEEDAHGCDQERRQQRPAEVVHREGVSSRSDASCSTRALSTRTSTKPSASMNGSRSAASSGGSTAFSSGDDGGHGERAAVPLDVDAGQDHRRNPSDAAVSAQDSSRRSGLNFGRSGCQETRLPVRRQETCAVTRRLSRPASLPSSPRAAPSAPRP